MGRRCGETQRGNQTAAFTEREAKETERRRRRMAHRRGLDQGELNRALSASLHAHCTVSQRIVRAVRARVVRARVA
ncbi:unnamed protein product [Boreogadus saida]